MTTPHQNLPDPVEELLGIGAFEIGGGGSGTNYGQDINEEFVNELVKMPFATFENMFEVLQKILLKLPIDALEGLKPFVPDWLEDEILDVAAAVEKIISSLADRKVIATLEEIVEAITGVVSGGLADLSAWVATVPFINDVLVAVADWLVEALTGVARDPGGDPLEDIFNALRNINFQNVLGIGGPGNVGATFQETWNQWIAGLTNTPGGSGAVLADFFNVGQIVSSNATKGSWSFDLLGIRGNRDFSSGFLPTTQAPVSLERFALGSATLPTITVTQTTAIRLYHRIKEASDYGVVSWQGYGVTNVTDCYINIYKMDTSTGGETLVHASTNQVGLLTGGSVPVPVVYSLPTAIAVDAGEVYSTEIAIRGAGTHNVMGTVSGLQDQAVFPRRHSARRNSGTSAAPSTITTGFSYATDVPFMEFGVSAGAVAIPHSPETVLFNLATTSSYPIPSWANTVQVIPLGGGGSGFSGSSSFNIDGEGGDAGTWNTGTWTRGTHFSGAASISVTVGAGGFNNGFGGLSGPGGNGGASSATVGAYTITGAGGAAGNGWASNTGNPTHRPGDSPGNQVYDGITYVGGSTQNTSSSVGSAPGGGGSGGAYFQAGGNGAIGSVWLRFKQ